MSEQTSVKSKTIKNGSLTYFIDIPLTKNGEKYLKITASRYMGQGKESQRSQILIFAKTVAEFRKAVDEVVDSEFK